MAKINDVYDQLQKLKKYEEDSMFKYQLNIDLDSAKGSTEKYNTYIHIVMEILSQERDISTGTIPPRWGHQPTSDDESRYFVTIPQMLCFQSTVLVPIHSRNLKKFTKFYGVLPEQLLQLAHDGFVIPYVYADSDLASSREDSKYSKCDHLLKIFDHEVTRCRINGIRRTKLFEAIGYSLEAQETQKERFDEKLKPIIYGLERNVGEKHLSQILKTDASVDQMGALATLKNNMLYLEIFGGKNDRDKLDEFMEISNHNIRTVTNVDNFIDWVRGRKSKIAAPITASFGGTYNSLSYEADIARNYARASDDSIGEVNEVGIRRSSLLDFYRMAAEIRAKASFSVSEDSLNLPMRQRLFENFLSFLKEKREILESVDRLLWANTIVSSGLGKSEFHTGLEYLRLFKDFFEDAGPGTGIWQLTTAGAYLAQFAEKTVPIDRRKSLKVLAGLTGAVAGAAVGHFGGDVLVRTAYSSLNADDAAARREIVHGLSRLTDIQTPGLNS